MVSLNLKGFKLLSRQGFYAQSHCDLDLLTPKSIRIIFRLWPYKKPIMVSLSIIGFKLLSRQGFYALGHGDLDLLPTDPKINSDYLWVMAIHDTKKGLP